jgi:ribonucleoside-diphosphate reductase alpha chain
LYRLGIAFDTEQAAQLADESMEFISYHAILASSQIAQVKGSYASFKGSKWDRDLLPFDTIALLEKERGSAIEVPKTMKMDWSPVREHIKKFGMRNSNTMAIAPTATISNIAGCIPTVEPIYKNMYVKSNQTGEFTVVNEYLVQALREIQLWNEDMVNRVKRADGSVQGIMEIPEDIRARFREVFEMDTMWIIKHAARRAKWIDQSQSVNIFSTSTSGKHFSELYVAAWNQGLKTTYYLRTLGASQVDRATLGTEVKAPEIALESVIEAAPVAAPVSAPIVEPVPVYAPQPAPAFAPAPVAPAPAPVTWSMPQTAPQAPAPVYAPQPAPAFAPAPVAPTPVAPTPVAAPVPMGWKIPAYQQAPVASAPIAPGPGAMSLDEPKLCRIDNPDCEACQ